MQKATPTTEPSVKPTRQPSESEKAPKDQVPQGLIIKPSPFNQRVTNDPKNWD